MDTADPVQRGKGLTARQRTVLDLIAKGMTNAQIGEALGISLDGAKWHVSEVLTRLDLRTREEAAEYWRRERRRGAGQAIGSTVRALRPAKWLGLAAAGLGAMVAVVFVVAVFNDSGTDAKTGPGEPAAADTSPAIARIEDVGFQVCGRHDGGWRRPTAEEMSDRFANPRFGDGLRPNPANWLLYLSRFQWGPVPLAVSANIEANAFGEKIALDPTRSVTYCDPAAFTVSMRFQDLRLADHEVATMESAGGSWRCTQGPRPGR